MYIVWVCVSLLFCNEWNAIKIRDIQPSNFVCAYWFELTIAYNNET